MVLNYSYFLLIYIKYGLDIFPTPINETSKPTVILNLFQDLIPQIEIQVMLNILQNNRII